MYENRKHPGTFQTRDITYKGRSDHIKDLRRDVMIKGRNESRDVVTEGRFKQTGT
jgi:predicted transcriptional regulator